MNYNKILSIFIFLLICNCADYQKKINEKKDSRIYYSSSGFALIYDELFYNNKTINKKINNEDIIVLHKTLKRNTPVRITNLSNNKYIDSKVFKKANYPKIFNLVPLRLPRYSCLPLGTKRYYNVTTCTWQYLGTCKLLNCRRGEYLQSTAVDTRVLSTTVINLAG